MSVVPLHPRGSVRDRDQYSQFKDYTQLKYGLITPSDIDGFIDFQGRHFVFLELKHVEAKPMQKGQRLAYERVCDACQRAGVKSIVLLAEHDYPPEDMIPVHALGVTKYRLNGTWREPKEAITVKAAIDKFIGKREPRGEEPSATGEDDWDLRQFDNWLTDNRA